MIDEGRRIAAEKGIDNVFFKQGSAYDLHEERGYDMAITRLAFHHMSDPPAALKEMAKAVRRGGTVVAVDLVSPDDERAAENYNLYEKLRDDSHTRALTKEELISMFKAHGLSEITAHETDVINDLELWMDMTGTTPQNRNIIKKAIRKDLNGREKTGFSPFVDEEGNIKFIHHWAMVIGKAL
jgi:SAM-dependent methyltransferase